MATKEFDASKVEACIGYTFRDKGLLLQAFTRSSYAKEHPRCESNEVLEFIGDSVLGMLTVKRLCKHFGYLGRGCYLSELSESELSEEKIGIVQGKTLAAATERAGLQRYLLLGSGDKKRKIDEQDSVKEDLFEAIIGAVVLDSGWDMAATDAVIERLLAPSSLLEGEDGCGIDYEDYVLDWNEKSYQKPPLILEEFFEGEEYPYFCCLELGFVTGDRRQCARSRTREGARRLCARQAYKTIEKLERRKAAALAAIGEPSLARAVNQLQELWQKGLIAEPRYEFKESQRRSESGNPMWECACIVDGLIENRGFMGENKQEVKRFAAMETLVNLLGVVIPWGNMPIVETERTRVSPEKGTENKNEN